MKNKFPDFPLKKLFIKIFKDEVYIVGGVVRDFILYKKLDSEKDIDLMVINHNYDEIEKKLRKYGKTNTVGKSFAVVKFTKDNFTYDISIPRKDIKKDKNSFNHKNFIIDAGKHISIEEDLYRRDFTCNSIALRLIDNKYIDPFNGMEAIEKRILKMTNPESFIDDPLRILRGARFSATHDLKIDEEIYLTARKTDLSHLSEERIFEEWFRLLLESRSPSRGMIEYFKLGILKTLFPEIYRLTLTIQDSIFHPETDEQGHHSVWGHSLIALDIANRIAKENKLNKEKRLSLLLATLLHDIGKPEVTEWEYKRSRMTIVSPIHDYKGGLITENLFNRLKIESKNKYPLNHVVINLIKNHHRLYELYRNKDTISFKAIAKLIKDMQGEEDLLLILDFADRNSRKPNHKEIIYPDEPIKWFIDKKNEYNINQNTIKPIVMGRHLIELGIKPDKKMGKYLNYLYELQLEGKIKSLEQGLEVFKKDIMNKEI